MQEKRNTKKIQLVTVIAVVVLFILILVLVTLVSQKVQMNAKKKTSRRAAGRSSTDDRKRFGGLRIPSVLGVYRKICERRAGNDRRRRHYMEAGGLIFARNIV